MASFQDAMGVPEGKEWEPFAGLDLPADGCAAFLASAPFARRWGGMRTAGASRCRRACPCRRGRMSTQEGFGRLLSDLARQRRRPGGADCHDLARRHRLHQPRRLGEPPRHLRSPRRTDVFREHKVLSTQSWAMSPAGQHIELGIAEHNLFLLLAALGLADPLFGVRCADGHGLRSLHRARARRPELRLLPGRAVHSGGHALGVSLAPEGGAHQSIFTPLIGMGLDRSHDLRARLRGRAGRDHAVGLRAHAAVGRRAVYLRLSTRPVSPPERR